MKIEDKEHTMDARATERHFWFGRWLSQEALEHELGTLEAHIADTLAQPFPLEALLAAAQHIADSLAQGSELYQRLAALAAHTNEPEEVAQLLQGAAQALQRDALLARLRAELGATHPASIERRYPARQFEAWLPVGCLVHVMPSNVFLVAALGLIEGLLAGNLNVVKLSVRDSSFAAVFAEALCEADASGQLRNYIAVLRLPSSESATLEALFSHADTLSAWGGESAIAAIRRMAPQGVRVVTWGHKLSFGYLAADILADETTRSQALKAFSADVCRLDQQACSSPQTLFLECDPEALQAYADELAAHLAAISPTIPGQTPETAEQAEITTVTQVAKAEEALGLTRVIEDPEGRWRIYVDTRPGLRPSPLFRSIWVKRVDRGQLVKMLRPMRAWLQTCGLACGLGSLAELTRALFATGVTRVVRPGEMTDSYVGAPHDGVYALQQFTRRVTLDAPESAHDVGSLSQLETAAPDAPPLVPIMTKQGFLEAAAPAEVPELIFRSGGSSGVTVFSTFTWADYHAQMQTAAHGLLAAGFDPQQDYAMNLFMAGNMYGSFISFWTILEKMGARVVPMAMVTDFAMIASTITQLKVNTLIGSPSHLIALFEQEGQRLNGVVEKVFYGGEALTRAQRRRLQETFGVRTVRSVAYGSNDAGPIGYQCAHCTGSEHHLFESIQEMEIVALEEDAPVPAGETGRILLTTSASLRSHPSVVRYEIGDTGRWLEGPCACGRQDRRFELQGRSSDLFKAGGPFFNARRFSDILDSKLEYSGLSQLHVLEEGNDIVLELWIHEGSGLPEDVVTRSIRQHYPEVEFCCTVSTTFHFRVKAVADAAFVRVAASGKLKPVCDHRIH
jgi:phenylacetate-coenzyme A ligase PaaK-like adenylate-forming protein/acyl-CoA reductase-like NAD-dependent aldehyde dehydrogenase